MYGIAKQSGGSISVESAPGRGSTFRIYLPRVEKVVDAAIPARTATPAFSTAAILVVEDNSQVRRFICRSLEPYGYQVVAAATVRDAAAICARRTDPINLLLTDILMPDGTGRDVAADVSIRWPDAKVLYVSGYTDEPIAADTNAAFLQKPFSSEALAMKIQDVLGAPDYGRGAGRSECPIRNASTPRAALRPSAIAHTISD